MEERMNQRSKLRLSILGAAAATTAVFAGTYVAVEPNETVVTAIEPMSVTETTIAPAPAPETCSCPHPRPSSCQRRRPSQSPKRAPAVPEPGIIVTEQRLTEDERIQAQVMDVLARNPSLTGKVGVETRDQVVNLSGYLMTNGQVMRAGRDAGSVIGVRYVVNEIPPAGRPITN
jgi:hypothetical protein